MHDTPDLAVSIRQAIDLQNRRFEEQFALRDASAIAALYTENAIIIPPQSEAMALVGQEAVLGWFIGAFDMGLGWIELDTESVTAVTDAIAIEVGRYRIGPSRNEVGDTGGYTAHWQHGADGWKIQRDVMTSALLQVVSRNLSGGRISR